MVEQEGCKIQWNAVEPKDPNERKHLSVRRECSIPSSEQRPLHRAILKEINNRWGIKEFGGFSWGKFGNKSDWSWTKPIAIASSKSPEYLDCKKNYHASTITSINALFVSLANQSGAYEGLIELFKEFGVRIELWRVERVFERKAIELPFSYELESHGITENTKLIYDVGFSYFVIEQ